MIPTRRTAHDTLNQQPTWGTKGGITIIISPELEQAWKRTDN